MPEHLFITGFLRSGTTLVDRLIDGHEDTFIASQPLFYAHVGMKARFLEARGLDTRPYPLGNLFLESEYRPPEFTDFLGTTAVPASWMEEAFVHCPEKERPRSIKWDPGRGNDDAVPFCRGVARALLHAAAPQHGPLRVVGSKEVICDEFIPAYLAEGTKVILVLRDPRAIVASIKCGKGHEYVNARLTILYILRQWRKNVATALACRPHPNFLSIRYEDLVQNPGQAMTTIFDWLGLPTVANPASGLHLQDRTGETWEGNSSFEAYTGISNRSVDRYRELLDPGWMQYIETVCAPEMTVTGYPLETGPDTACIDRFEEPLHPGDATVSSPESASRPDCRTQEAKRLELLQSGPADHEIDPWFIFETAYAAMRSGELMFPVIQPNPH